MEFDDELGEFDGICRLFPLPNFVMFPYAVVPLHIFEPRYREMTEDALAGDRLLAMVQIRPDADWKAALDPAIERVACLGRILEYERLPDGRFHFLLVGQRRARIIRELPRTRSYRQAEVELLPDEYPGGGVDPIRDCLVRLFRRVTERSGPGDEALTQLLDSGIELGPLTDIIGQSLGLPGAVKQTLLAESRVDNRAKGLIGILEHLLGLPRNTPRTCGYPPPFSDN